MARVRLRMAVVSVLAALAAACSSSVEVSYPSGTITTHALPPIPSAPELDAQLRTVLDPAVPAAQKAQLVQGVQADPGLMDQLAEIYRSAGASAVVTGVSPDGAGLKAAVEVTLNGRVTAGSVPFVAEDGRWKVANAWACAKVETLRISSPACPTPAPSTGPGR